MPNHTFKSHTLDCDGGVVSANHDVSSHLELRASAYSPMAQIHCFGPAEVELAESEQDVPAAF